MGTYATATRISRSGTLLSSAFANAAAATDKFSNDGSQFLVVRNAGASPDVVTFTIQSTVDSQVVTPRTVSVAAGETKEIGPFPPSIYNDANGFVNIAHSYTTTVTCLVKTNVPEKT